MLCTQENSFVARRDSEQRIGAGEQMASEGTGVGSSEGRNDGIGDGRGVGSGDGSRVGSGTGVNEG